MLKSALAKIELVTASKPKAVNSEGLLPSLMVCFIFSKLGLFAQNFLSRNKFVSCAKALIVHTNINAIVINCFIFIILQKILLPD